MKRVLIALSLGSALTLFAGSAEAFLCCGMGGYSPYTAGYAPYTAGYSPYTAAYSPAAYSQYTTAYGPRPGQVRRAYRRSLRQSYWRSYFGMPYTAGYASATYGSPVSYGYGPVNYGPVNYGGSVNYGPVDYSVGYGTVVNSPDYSTSDCGCEPDYVVPDCGCPSDACGANFPPSSDKLDPIPSSPPAYETPTYETPQGGPTYDSPGDANRTFTDEPDEGDFRPDSGPDRGPDSDLREREPVDPGFGPASREPAREPGGGFERFDDPERLEPNRELPEEEGLDLDTFRPESQPVEPRKNREGAAGLGPEPLDIADRVVDSGVKVERSRTLVRARYSLPRRVARRYDLERGDYATETKLAAAE